MAHRNRWFTYQKWWFSIVMLNNQMVPGKMRKHGDVTSNKDLSSNNFSKLHSGNWPKKRDFRKILCRLPHWSQACNPTCHLHRSPATQLPMHDGMIIPIHWSRGLTQDLDKITMRTPIKPIQIMTGIITHNHYNFWDMYLYDNRFITVDSLVYLFHH